VSAVKLGNTSLKKRSLKPRRRLQDAVRGVLLPDPVHRAEQRRVVLAVAAALP
jgi:hypothetical protein